MKSDLLTTTNGLCQGMRFETVPTCKYTKFVLDGVKNIVEKGENAVTSFFSFSHDDFKRFLL